MSRDETGKQKTARILPDYYRRADWLQRGKLLLATAALPLAIGYCAWGALRPESHYAPGPLAAVHATWENQCQNCHTAFKPIRDDAWASTRHDAQLSAKNCAACHRGPQHHEAQKPGEVASCAACHVDHRGRDASLVRVSDQACITCHSDLSRHSTRSVPPEREKVTRFDAKNHPEFRSARSDPGKLKFSHWRHMSPGMNLGPGDRFPPKKWQDLRPTDQRRYGRRESADGAMIDDGDIVQLNCAACHQSDYSKLAATSDDRTPAIAVVPQASGAYFLPMTYAKDCQACHSLDFDPEVTEGATKGRIPHGLSPTRIREFLQGVYANKYLESKPELLTNKISLTGPRLPNQIDPSDNEEARTWIDEKIKAADRNLRGRCAECHDLPGRPTEMAIPPTQTPQIWLSGAKFDHAAHRAADCRVCHEKVYEKPVVDLTGGTSPSALDNEQVLIPKLEMCVKCHAPNRPDGFGGARFDCVECHRYHNGDNPLEGLGSSARGAEHARTLQDFFRGSQSPGEPSGDHSQ